MKPRSLIRHRYSQAHDLAAVVLVATACGLTGTLANAQGDNLVTAAARGDLPAVSALLKSGADVNAPKPFKYSMNTTALIEASSSGHLEVVQALLAAKADVNAKATSNVYGEVTALMLASDNGHLELVQALLAARADVDAKSSDGVTALYLA
jgi:ankyrin repeat protein